MSRIQISDLGSCRKCGKCCRALYIPHSYRQIKRMARVQEFLGIDELQGTALFIMRHFRRLSHDEVRIRAPELNDAKNAKKGTFWSCEYLNRRGLCRLQVESRPKPYLCSGYPWYGATPRKRKFLRPGCGYHT